MKRCRCLKMVNGQQVQCLNQGVWTHPRYLPEDHFCEEHKTSFSLFTLDSMDKWQRTDQQAVVE